MALLASVGHVQLLNCARGQATTISALQDFARKTENLICLLQEPWCDRHGNPPSLPGFDIFTPSPIKPRCVTYIRRTPGLTATTVFTAQDSFLATTITTLHDRKLSHSLIFILQDERSHWLQFFQPSNHQTIAYSWETLMHTTRGGRGLFRRLFESHVPAR
jgi:hypothetical protein